MKFELDANQEAKFEKWQKNLNKKKGECYVGAAGGAYSFVFIPTGLGDIIEVHRADGEKLDLTDFENW